MSSPAGKGARVLPIVAGPDFTSGAAAVLNDRLGRVLNIGQTPAATIVIQTHSQRLNAAPKSYATGTVLIESDRGYQYYTNGTIWKYIGGTSIGAATYTDLNMNDVGAIFITSGAWTISIWDGAAWHAV